MHYNAVAKEISSQRFPTQRHEAQGGAPTILLQVHGGESQSHHIAKSCN